MPIPLAIAAAAPRISILSAIRSASSLHLAAPAGNLVAGASAGLPLGHVVARAEWVDPRLAAQPCDFLLIPPFDHVGNGAIRPHKEHGRDTRNPIIVAGRETAFLGIEQRGERHAELAIELPGILGVVLRNAVDGQGAPGVKPFEEREGELANGTTDLEKCQQHRPARNQFLDRKSTRLNSSHLGISYA